MPGRMYAAVVNGSNIMMFFRLSKLLGPIMGQRLKDISRTAEFLWILSLMRSGSSLLSHLLVNHPGIEGFGECWIRYEGTSDFQELIARVRLYNALERLCRRRYDRPGDPQIILDKLLHNKLLPCLELLNEPQLKLIFLLRQPHDIVTSLLRAGKPFPHSGSLELAAGYCTSRLQALKRYATSIHEPRKSLALHYERLVDRTQETLQCLQAFLGLNRPLTESYELSIATGIAGLGDPTKLIKTGRVVKKHRPPPFDIPKEILRDCNREYNCCQEALAKKGVAVV
jgi:hypothetical protein